MLRRLGRMDPLKRLLKPKLASDSSVPPLAYGQIMDSPWLKQIRQLSAEIEEKAKVEQSARQASNGIESNPYYSKYADRIKQKKTEEVSKPKAEVKTEAPKSEASGTDAPVKAQESDNSSDSAPKAQDAPTESKRTILSAKSKKSLANIMKTELLEGKTAEEISEIWAAYHSNRDCIYATIPKATYEEFYSNIKQYPMFILPLPRANAQVEGSAAHEQGQQSECYEFFFLQAQEHAVYLTSLSAIQLHKEMAPVSLSIYHYPELMESKGITLMMGEYDTNLLTAIEVQCLANQLQYYYTTKDPASKLTLHLFNKEPKSFDHMRLIRQLEEGLLSQTIGSVDLKAQD